MLTMSATAAEMLSINVVAVGIEVMSDKEGVSGDALDVRAELNTAVSLLELSK